MPRDPIRRGGDDTQLNFWGPLSTWKRGWRIIMFLYMRLSRKSYVKHWHKCFYGHVKQIEKGCHVIPTSGGGGGGKARSSISVDLFQHGKESLCTFTCVSPANLKSNFIFKKTSFR